MHFVVKTNLIESASEKKQKNKGIISKWAMCRTLFDTETQK